MKMKQICWILGLLCDIALWPYPWIWPWIFRVNVWNNLIAGMGGPIGTERKGCEQVNPSLMTMTVAFGCPWWGGWMQGTVTGVTSDVCTWSQPDCFCKLDLSIELHKSIITGFCLLWHSIGFCFTEMEMSPLRNCRHWLHRKLSFWQLTVQPLQPVHLGGYSLTFPAPMLTMVIWPEQVSRCHQLELDFRHWNQRVTMIATLQSLMTKSASR